MQGGAGQAPRSVPADHTAVPPPVPAVTTQRSPTKKQLLKEAEEMLDAGRSPLRDSMIMRQ